MRAKQKLSLETDAFLTPSIQLQSASVTSTHPPNNIFLTGATGFLGTYLLFELLQKTESTIYCLIRAKTVEMAQQRLEKQLSFYQLWQEPFRNRLIPIVGDISQPCLGLTKQQFHQLANQVEVVYHSAAQATPVYPYPMLKAVNVTGTEQVIRFAATGYPKPVHYISSVIAFFSQPYLQRTTPILEHEIPTFDKTLKGGYKQSKWVAEQLVWQAKERGLPISIYRPSRILADTQTGVIGSIDLFWKVVIGCLLLKKYPVSETELNLVPVDYVSRVIVTLTQREESIGQAFHLVNPQPLCWATLWQQINRLGYLIEPTSYDDWVAEINQHTAENRLFAQLRGVLRAPIVLFKPKPTFDTQQTEQTLQPLGLTCPSIDGPLLNTYLTYLQQAGHISQC